MFFLNMFLIRIIGMCVLTALLQCTNRMCEHCHLDLLPIIFHNHNSSELNTQDPLLKNVEKRIYAINKIREGLIKARGTCIPAFIRYQKDAFTISSFGESNHLIGY